MIKEDDAPAGSITRTRRAEHAHQHFNSEAEICRAEVGSCDGLEYVAHLTTGTWDFSVHCLKADLVPENLDQAARSLYLIVHRLNDAASMLHSGELIRLVLQGDRGALFYDVKVTGQGFFAATTDGSRETVDRVDRALEKIADTAAMEAGAPSLNLGAYQKRSTRDQWLRRGDGGITPAEHLARPFPVSDSRTVPEPVMSRCRQALDLADLHFVAVYRNHRLAWRADLFDAPDLEQLFTRVAPDIRRLGYDQVVRQIDINDRRISQLLNVVHSRRLTRLVLDVARGAVYVMPFGDGEHCLIGVTLVQSLVKQTDRKMTKLFKELVPWFPGDGTRK